MSKDSKELTSYLVMGVRNGSEDVEVLSTHPALIEAFAQQQCFFLEAEIVKVWVERMTQKRIGQMLEKPRVLGPVSGFQG